ncbi:hypothetical protein [Thermanaerosceptrum fracticalcis]|uniref:hypothetical protein n=1 Tax=Thermanaerosceptrum fracticalcis TaxID=1712410 RepID=UPI00068C8851|nr:hypothetical protein [Thermanaerosceptrum fracticalcis]
MDAEKSKEKKISITEDQLEAIINQRLEAALKEKAAAPVVQVVHSKKAPDEKPGADPQEIVSYLNERVPFRAFKDSKKYKDDISVQVNGKIWLIKRGETVYIPRFVYLAIDQAERQLAEAANFQLELTQKFEENRTVLS